MLCQSTIQMYSYDDLTSRQAEILEFIVEFKQKKGNSPTYREISDHFGFKGPKAAVDHVFALEKKGYLRRHAGRSRGIELNVPGRGLNDEIISVPVLGDIAAGYPEEQDEYNLGTIAVDLSMLGNSRNHRMFALQVRGDSMEGRGIHEGDWVVADADMSPNENDVVVALIDGENTLKTLAKKKGLFYLKAENPEFLDLIPFERIMIQGVVKVIFRRMHS